MWSLVLAAANLSLVERIERPGQATVVRFAAVDDQGAGLDCIKIVGLGKGSYLGLSHSLRGGAFELRLSESSDLKAWRHIVTLDRHAHQGTLTRVGSEWLAAWEKDGPNGNWIRVARFDSLAAFRAGKPSQTADLPRSLSRFAEGTPSLRLVDWRGGWAESVIELDFHYYREGVVDRQAQGTLTGFTAWKAGVRDGQVSGLDKAYGGNIGDRDLLPLPGGSLELLEAQEKFQTWDSWRILAAVDGGPFRRLLIRTPGGSRSFANPAISKVELPDGRPGIVVSLFLPSEGAARGEAGSLIYAFPWP